MFHLVSENGITVLRSSLLDDIPGVSHAFTTRLGGVSQGIYEALNLSLAVGDSCEAVRENRSRVGNILGAATERITLQSQQHAAGVVRLERSGRDGEHEADAFVTTETATPALVGTADCVPILMASEDGSVVAAVHAGWRGIVAGVIANAVDVMARICGARPERIRAAVGPHIRPCCFEVGHEVAICFPANAVISRGNDLFVDMAAAATERLSESGIRQENIDISLLCTRCRSDLFFSHRGSGGRTGRMASVILRSA